jgi:hypothetical protein
VGHIARNPLQPEEIAFASQANSGNMIGIDIAVIAA